MIAEASAPIRAVSWGATVSEASITSDPGAQSVPFTTAALPSSSKAR
jgi:hypothetical protein